MLHAVYSIVADRVAFELFGIDTRAIYQAFCGDDEDKLHRDWTAAATVLGITQLMGHNLNPTKQLAGKHSHEFLQRTAAQGKPPARPLAPMVANLASGNWYRPSATYYFSQVPAWNDTAHEMVNRGANWSTLRAITTRMLNRIYTVIPNKADPTSSMRKLEWWCYRHGTQDGSEHPFWKGTGTCLPWPEQQPLDLHVWVPNTDDGTAAWIRNVWHIAKHITTGQFGAYIKQVHTQSYRSMYKHKEIEHECDEASHLFGKRHSRPPKAIYANMLPTPPKRDQLRRALSATGGGRKLPTEASMAASLGIDVTLFRLIGGWPGLIATGNPSISKHFVHIMTLNNQQLPTWIDYVDPAIASWLRSRAN
jgi:hypothetical protein